MRLILALGKHYIEVPDISTTAALIVHFHVSNYHSLILFKENSDSAVQALGHVLAVFSNFLNVYARNNFGST